MQTDKRAAKRSLTILAECGIGVCIFAVTLFLIYRFAIIGFDAHHTGLMYKTALDVARGGVIFRDTFTQYGALTSLLQALFIRMMGERVTSILFATAFFYAASHTALYALARRFFDKRISLGITFVALMLAPFYTWTFHPWSSVFSLFFLLIALYATLIATQKRSFIAAFLAGVFAMLAFWCRQPVGIVTALAALLCLAFFAWQSEKKSAARRRYLLLLIPLFAGLLCGFFAFFIPLAANGALHDFYRQCIEGMVTFASDRSSTERFGIFGVIGTLLYCLLLAPLVQWFSPGINYIWVLLPLSSLALFVIAFRKLRRERDEKAAKTFGAYLVLSVFAVASWHQYYPVSCYRHWYWAAFPSIISLCLLTKMFFEHPPKRVAALLTTKKRQILAFVLAGLLLFGSNVIYHGTAGIINQVENSDRVIFENEHYTHLDGLYLDPDVAAFYTELFDSVAFLEELFPERNIINTTENGVFALFGENFCPIYNNSGDFYYKEYPDLLAAYIKKERPIIIGPEAPDESYLLWRAPAGDPADPYAEYHRMPAKIYLPIELYAQIPMPIGE